MDGLIISAIVLALVALAYVVGLEHGAMATVAALVSMLARRAKVVSDAA